MRNLILFLLLFSPIFAFAEYNGIHIEFNILLNDGNKAQGYKYIAHGENNKEFKQDLEAKTELLLKNEYSFEPGDYGFYQKQLKYKYNDSFVYQLIEPTEIDLSKIKTVKITSVIVSSYATQINSELIWEDRIWMNSEPITKYTQSEDLCSYDIFIHKSGDIREEVIEKVKLIIHQADIKIKAKENESEFDSDQEYDDAMKEFYDERSLLLKPFFDKYKGLKTIIIDTCTC